MHVELAERDGTGVHYLAHDMRVLGGHASFQDRRGALRRDAGSVEVVLEGDGHAVQRPPQLAAREGRIGLGGAL